MIAYEIPGMYICATRDFAMSGEHVAGGWILLTCHTHDCAEKDRGYLVKAQRVELTIRGD